MYTTESEPHRSITYYPACLLESLLEETTFAFARFLNAGI